MKLYGLILSLVLTCTCSVALAQKKVVFPQEDQSLEVQDRQLMLKLKVDLAHDNYGEEILKIAQNLREKYKEAIYSQKLNRDHHFKAFSEATDELLKKATTRDEKVLVAKYVAIIGHGMIAEGIQRETLFDKETIVSGFRTFSGDSNTQTLFDMQMNHYKSLVRNHEAGFDTFRAAIAAAKDDVRAEMTRSYYNEADGRVENAQSFIEKLVDDFTADYRNCYVPPTAANSGCNGCGRSNEKQ